MRQKRQMHRFGTCCNNALIKADSGDFAVLDHLNHVRAGKSASTFNGRHFARFREPCETTRKLPHNAIFKTAQLVEINLRLGKADTMRAHIFGISNHLGHV